MIKTLWVAYNDDSFKDVRYIRETVFVEEYNINYEEEFDDLDTTAMHMLVFDGYTPIGTGRVMLDGEKAVIGRLAVLKDFRREGIGDLIVRLLIRKAFDSGAKTQSLHAMTYCVDFYKKVGFEVISDEYLEVGIPHVTMERHGDVFGCGGH